MNRKIISLSSISVKRLSFYLLKNVSVIKGEKMKNSIYVVTHKEFNYKLLASYIPIQVGKINTGLSLPYITDDTGDNISSKNSNYCELTAVYWIWKNVKNVDNVGICHYRRYFVTGLSSRLIDDNYIDKTLENYDVILPTKYKTESSVYNHFINSTSGREVDLINLRKIISEIYPDYLESYDKIMKSRSTSYCNMLVTSKENYDTYCKWLFDILFSLEKITNMDGYTKQEQRLYGFLSEFLLNVWIDKNGLKVKYCNMYYIGNSKVKNCLKKIKLGLKDLFKKG